MLSFAQNFMKYRRISSVFSTALICKRTHGNLWQASFARARNPGEELGLRKGRAAYIYINTYGHTLWVSPVRRPVAVALRGGALRVLRSL
eukprot:6181757-Pleurochrysis_carterae.AAC.1